MGSPKTKNARVRHGLKKPGLNRVKNNFTQCSLVDWLDNISQFVVLVLLRAGQLVKVYCCKLVHPQTALQQRKRKPMLNVVIYLISVVVVH